MQLVQIMPRKQAFCLTERTEQDTIRVEKAKPLHGGKRRAHRVF